MSLLRKMKKVLGLGRILWLNDLNYRPFMGVKLGLCLYWKNAG
jgi:hypothetical protein